jgi:putative cell wall-binding protein
MSKSLKTVFTLGLSLVLLLPSSPSWAQPLPQDSSPIIPLSTVSNLTDIDYSSTQGPDVIWENDLHHRIMASNTPLATYSGSSGVTINSYSTQYSSNAQLQKVHDELLKNTVGPELSYLSHIDLYPNFPYGNGVAGRWYGLWKNNKLANERSIELYGVDSLSFAAVSHTLSHEYGHHFTHYYLNQKEGTLSDLANSGFTKLRALSSYTEYQNSSHVWSPEEIAAEDYAQLFGSPTWKKGLEYQDVRDVALNQGGDQTRQISSLDNYNVQPQENLQLPLATEVPGLYSYWLTLSGLSERSDHTPPSQPYLSVTQVEGKTVTLSWSSSTDNQTKDIRYTVVYNNSSFPEAPMGLRTTTDSKGRDAIIGSYSYGRTLYSDRILSGKTSVRVHAQDEAGNVSRSNLLTLEEGNLTASLSPLPNRISGTDRYETSVELSKSGWPNGSSTAILVTGNDYPDALSAAPLAQKYNAPILLTGLSLDPKIEVEITRLKAKEIIIVGGLGAVPESVELKLKQKGIQTRRIEGLDRYSTALSVAKELGLFNKVFIATGENFPDALSAAPIAASLGIPILLTNTNQLPESVETFLEKQPIYTSYVLGGTGVVSDNVFAKLPNPKRISGLSRYETNVALLNSFRQSLNLETIYLATGNNFPDALSGSVVASLTKSPIILTDTGYTSSAQSLISENKGAIKNYLIIGGDGALRNTTIAEILN